MIELFDPLENIISN